MYQREITDEDFLNSFQNFVFAARPALSYLLCEKLNGDSTLREGDVKIIILQVIENYYYQTEIVLMILESMPQKKMNPIDSFIGIYHKMFIRERNDGIVSTKLLKKFTESGEEELFDYLGFKKISQLLSELSKERKEEIEEVFGSFDKAIEQANKEIINLKGSLEAAISNRIKMKDESPFPFYQMLNKLKHGYQVVEDENENVLSIIIELVKDKSDGALFEVIEVPVKKETAYFFADQTKYMAQAKQHLIQYYMLSK
ncbi:hypothetical protein [Immundisolibacter sp.]